jgi:hypothetical protein
MELKRMRWVGAAIAASALALVGASAPSFLFAADHLDAPGLTSPSARADADINDVYVFADGPDRTAIAVTTHPGVGAIAPAEYATDVIYKINVDTNSDYVEDVAYAFYFSPKQSAGDQLFNLVRFDGTGARTLQGGTRIVGGRTGRTATAGNGTSVFAGLRSDPFYFDLDAFRGAVLGADNGRTFCDANTNDFFSSLNTNAVVLSIPRANIPAKINVWATTLAGNGAQIDRMGRPAINAVFNAGEDKNRFNAGQPSVDGPVFARNTGNTLRTFSGLDSEGAYKTSELHTLNGVLLPDVIPFDASKPVDGVLNGRWLANDVIDAELNIVTGGYPFTGRDAKGAIQRDCVGAHSDYKAGFPFLGDPHQG